MRQLFHTSVLARDLCDLYIFTGLDVYDVQDLQDQP